MIALIYLVALLLYLALSIAVVVGVGRWAVRNGKKRWAWMTGAATVMYLLVFWDLVPTIVMHRYLCSTYAGVTIHKTPEVWLAENRGGPKGPLKDVKELFPGRHDSGNAKPDGRLALGSSMTWRAPLPVVTTKTVLVDRLNGEALVEKRTVDSGYPEPGTIGGWRLHFLWLRQPSCSLSNDNFTSVNKEFLAAELELK
jgi:hypothetical protein